jgi:hypothetical protein
VYFCGQLGRVKQLFEAYRGRAEFLFVYISGHGELPPPLRSVVADPSAAVDAPVNRLARIRAGVRHFGVAIPCVVDEEDTRAEQAYQASPGRLFIVDQGGLIAFVSGPVDRSGLALSGAAAWLEAHTSP